MKKKCNHIRNFFLGFFLTIASFYGVGSQDDAYSEVYSTLNEIKNKWQKQAQDTKPNSVVSNPLTVTTSLTTTIPDNTRLAGQGIPIGEELFFSSYFNRYYLGEIIAVKNESSIWVDLASFVEILDFFIDVDTEKLTAQGWFINTDNEFTLDVNNLNAAVNNTKYAFNKEDTYIDQSDIYIDIKLLKQWFTLNIELDYSELNLHISSKNKLPIEARLARENRVLGTQAQLKEPTLPWKPSPYQIASTPLADLQLNAVITEDDSTYGYSLLGANDLAYFNTEYYFAGRETDLLADSRLTFSRQSNDYTLLGAMSASTIQFGDITATQVGNQFNGDYARGVKVNNKPLFREVNNNQVNLTGAVQPGWDVELYRNGLLIGQQLSLADGRYLFENIDLIYGQNNFELILYGPQGQVERKTQQYFIDGNSLKSGESFYDLSITEQGHKLFDKSQYLTGGKGWQLAGRYETGITNYLSVYGGVSALKAQEGESSSIYAVGTNISIADKLLLNIDYEQSDNRKNELEIVARGELAGQSLRFSLNQENRHENEADTSSKIISVDSYKLNMSGNIFEHKLGRLNYQNTLTRFENDVTGSRFTIDNILNYALNGISLSNQLQWRDSDSLSEPVLTGDTRLQGRIGRTYSRFIVDYTVKPTKELLGYGVEFNRSLSSNIQAELTLRNVLENDLTSGELGLSWNSDRFSVNSNMSYDSDSNWRLGLFSRFSFGYSPTNNNYFVSQRSLAKSGSLMVNVFLDENNNGVMDENERGVEGIKVKGLQNYRQAITDENGVALLTGMTANRTTDIVIDPDSFSDPFFVAANDGFSITPRAGFVEFMSIALNNSSEIEGTVYQQSDGESSVEPFANVKLIDKNGKQIAKTQAAYDGYYLFTDLRPGEYSAVIDNDYKERKSLKATQQVTVNLPARGEVVAGVDFILKEIHQSPSYIANIGKFSSPAIMKAYYQLIKPHLKGIKKQSPFYINDKKNQRYILAIGYAQSEDNQLDEMCNSIRLKGLNCDVQSEIINH